MQHKSIIVNGYSDHVHILIGHNPVMSVSETVRNIKRSSALLINQEKWFRGTFQWQEGYGAFSLNRKEISRVYKYIENQVEHHKKNSFKEEYLQLLRENEITFDDKYLFNFF